MTREQHDCAWASAVLLWQEIAPHYGADPDDLLALLYTTIKRTLEAYDREVDRRQRRLQPTEN